MLSIIISSYQQDFYQNLVKNIAETIGENFVYETIQIQNPKLMGICEAYNQGGTKANFEYLLFIHEDIEFLTSNWGEKLVVHLKNEHTGIVGLAGSIFKSNYPSSWSVIQECRRVNIVQRKRTGEWATELLNPENESKSKVTCLDGVLLGIRKATWEQTRFDEKRYKGFHGYDVDFSLAISFKINAFVIYDILIKHFSPGNQSPDWMSSAMIVSTKWKSHLPHSINKFSKHEFALMVYKSFDWFVYKMKALGYNKVQIFYLSLKYIKLHANPWIYILILKVYLKLLILK